VNRAIRSQKQLARLDEALSQGTLADVAGILGDLTPADTAHLISSSPPRYQYVLWGLLDSEQEAEVLNELSEDLRNKFIAEMDPEDLAAIVDKLDDDDVADILQELPDSITAQVLAIMDEQDRARLELVLGYPDDVAGGLMSTDTVTVRPDLTLDVVLRYLRRHPELPMNTDNVIVVNRQDRYIGILPLRTLLVSDPNATVREMMDTEQPPIPAQMPESEVARLFERNDWISAPVVDDQGLLIGRITIDDVVDVIREEADHSIASLGRVSEEDTFATIRQTAPRRAIWLGINLVTALLASSVINLFQGTIEKVVALAVLMPIVASMGGIAGTQTLTVLIRGLAMGHINNRNERWLLGREVAVGLFNGLLWAAVVAVAAAVWFNDWLLGGVIAAAMIINLIAAGFFGALLPLVMQRVKIDPALAGGVVLTTVTDVVGFLSFLGLATLLYA
jgi:magnesium transporter